MKNIKSFDSFINESFNNFFENCKTAKEAILKATTYVNYAKKRENSSQADKVIGNLKEFLDSINYNWKRDPHAMELLGDFVMEKSNYEDDEDFENDELDTSLFPDENLEDEDFENDEEEEDEEEEEEEEVDTLEEGDYSEVSEHMDKFMNEDPDTQNEFYEILDSKDVEDLTNFFENNIQDEDRFNSYLPEGGTIKGFAQWLVDNISE